LKTKQLTKNDQIVVRNTDRVTEKSLRYFIFFSGTFYEI